MGATPPSRPPSLPQNRMVHANLLAMHKLEALSIAMAMAMVVANMHKNYDVIAITFWFIENIAQLFFVLSPKVKVKRGANEKARVDYTAFELCVARERVRASTIRQSQMCKNRKRRIDECLTERLNEQ